MPSRTADRRIRLAAAFLLAAVALALLPAAAAKGILEDPARYPPGVTAVTRTAVQPGQEFHVQVNHDGTFTAARMQICRFNALSDETANVCWTQFRADPVDGAQAFSADSSQGQHPRWEAGWVIGYKLLLDGPEDATLPAVGGEYFKVVVGEASDDVASTGPSRAAPFCAICVAAIGGAAFVRRRWG